MLFAYKRKISKQSCLEENIARAIGAIRHEKMDWLKAKETFNLSQVTLTRRCQDKSKLSRYIVKTGGLM
jgi:hypothetical protein